MNIFNRIENRRASIKFVPDYLTMSEVEFNDNGDIARVKFRTVEEIVTLLELLSATDKDTREELGLYSRPWCIYTSSEQDT